MRRRRAALIDELERGLEAVRRGAARFARRPRVYFEEWDEPQISGIRWVSELIGIAGGDDCFPSSRASRWARTASSPIRSKCRAARPT